LRIAQISFRVRIEATAAEWLTWNGAERKKARDVDADQLFPVFRGQLRAISARVVHVCALVVI